MKLISQKYYTKIKCPNLIPRLTLQIQMDSFLASQQKSALLVFFLLNHHHLPGPTEPGSVGWFSNSGPSGPTRSPVVKLPSSSSFQVLYDDCLSERRCKKLDSTPVYIPGRADRICTGHHKRYKAFWLRLDRSATVGSFELDNGCNAAEFDQLNRWVEDPLTKATATMAFSSASSEAHRSRLKSPRSHRRRRI